MSHFTRLYFLRVNAVLLKFWMKPASFGGFLSTESVRFTETVSESGSGKMQCWSARGHTGGTDRILQVAPAVCTVERRSILDTAACQMYFVL